MTAHDGTEPIADDELLYRRIPASTNRFTSEHGLQSEAFMPHRENDIDGISVVRAKYKSIEQAAKGRPGKSYYVAVLNAGVLKMHGIDARPDPLPNDPGHAVLPGLRSDNRDTPFVLELMQRLVQLCRRVEGPFPSTAAEPGTG